MLYEGIRKFIACDSVEALSKTSAKRIHIEGNADITALKNVRDIQKTDSGISFLYSGDINEFLQYISKYKINDLSISEPDLEEIFMHYYLDGGDR